jgi:hypothetical protein
VQAPSTGVYPTAGNLDRIVGEDGLVFHAALAQTHAAAILEVNGRD